MASIRTIRKNIAARLDTIDGLRAEAYVPNQTTPPAAFVVPRSINYDATWARGSDSHLLEVHVLVSTATDRASQEKLDEFLDSTSIKDTLEARPLIDGAETLRVVSMESYGTQELGGQKYYGATFVIDVLE